jgi:hypothetical protein
MKLDMHGTKHIEVSQHTYFPPGATSVEFWYVVLKITNEGEEDLDLGFYFYKQPIGLDLGQVLARIDIPSQEEVSSGSPE